ncbi:hypothetical protein BRO79_12310 [Salmonella enterica]|uniref:Ash family protein n=1 Tax=Salmonella enterica TaxID=28901 RepID=A0A5U6SIH9_SALER|nr:hypothetical protein [Salmonella enterica]
MPGQQKKSLNAVIAGCYIFLAVTVLMVGRGNPLQLPATQSAARAFFIVATFFAIERQIMAWCMPSSACRAAAVMHDGVHHSTMSMVAQAGPLSGGPVSGNAGISTPVWAIASERGNSSDSMNPCYQRLPSWLRPQQKNTQNPRSPNSVTTVVVSVGVRVKNTVKNHCADLALRDIVTALLQIQQPGFASRTITRRQNTPQKRVFCCLMPHVQWRYGRELLRRRRVPSYLVMRIPFVLPPMASHPLMVVKNLLTRRLPQWLLPQPQNTQNPRSPNSATTAAVRFTVRRWWRYIFILIYWLLISMRSRYICRTYFLTSTTILRL